MCVFTLCLRIWQNNALAQLRFDFDHACPVTPVHTPFGSVHLTHLSKSQTQRMWIILSLFTRKSKYAIINLLSCVPTLISWYTCMVTLFELNFTHATIIILNCNGLSAVCAIPMDCFPVYRKSFCFDWQKNYINLTSRPV